MPYDGEGNFTPLPPPQFPAVPDEIIKASYFNNIINDIINGLSRALLKNGEGGAEGDINMRDFRLINLGRGSAAHHSLRVQDYITNEFGQLNSVAGVNAITANTAYPVTTIAEGARFSFYPVATNTDSVTLNINNKGAKPVRQLSGEELIAGMLKPNTLVEVTSAGSFYALRNMPLQSVDSTAVSSTRRNFIVNGSFAINRLGQSATKPISVPAGQTALVDNWFLWSNSTPQADAFLVEQIDTVHANGRSKHALKITVNQSFVSTQFANTHAIGTHIEGRQLQGSGWAKAAGRSSAFLSFQAKTNVPGTYSGAVRVANGAYVYPFTYTLTGTDWQEITITIPPSPSPVGIADNVWTLSVWFLLAAGPNNRVTTFNQWLAGTDFVSNIPNIAENIASYGNSISFAQVQLEFGQKTSFEVLSYNEEMALCSRYMAVGYLLAGEERSSFSANTPGLTKKLLKIMDLPEELICDMVMRGKDVAPLFGDKLFFSLFDAATINVTGPDPAYIGGAPATFHITSSTNYYLAFSTTTTTNLPLIYREGALFLDTGSRDATLSRIDVDHSSHAVKDAVIAIIFRLMS